MSDLRCGKCGEQIDRGMERPCVTCKKVFHYRCLTENEACPLCCGPERPPAAPQNSSTPKFGTSRSRETGTALIGLGLLLLLVGVVWGTWTLCARASVIEAMPPIAAHRAQRISAQVVERLDSLHGFPSDPRVAAREGIQAITGAGTVEEYREYLLSQGDGPAALTALLLGATSLVLGATIRRKADA